jgi:hypothetical protein
MQSESGNALGIIGFIMSIIGIIYTAVNHKHIRGKCCGKDIDISLDIDSTTDTEKAAKAAKEKDATEAAADEAAEAAEKKEKAQDKYRSIKIYPEAKKYRPTIV